MNVVEKYAKPLKSVEDQPHRSVVVIESVPQILFPCQPSFGIQVNWLVQTGRGEVEHEWSGDDCHFDHEKRIFVVRDCGHVESGDLLDGTFHQSQVDVAFPAIVGSIPEHLDGGRPVGPENDPFLSAAKSIRDCQASLPDVEFGSFFRSK